MAGGVRGAVCTAAAGVAGRRKERLTRTNNAGGRPWATSTLTVTHINARCSRNRVAASTLIGWTKASIPVLTTQTIHAARESRHEALACDIWRLLRHCGSEPARRGAELSVVRQLWLSFWRWRHQLRLHNARAVLGDGQRHRRLLRSQHTICAAARTVGSAPSAAPSAPRPRLIDGSLAAGLIQRPVRKRHRR